MNTIRHGLFQVKLTSFSFVSAIFNANFEQFEIQINSISN